ncbi:hypothetical protein C8Q80DRAFT_158488 [Daedaleopsis nitida]|nr:hypothetical protein C8Q80DRAFT_158488 [Daedaleopsis nitida]
MQLHVQWSVHTDAILLLRITSPGSSALLWTNPDLINCPLDSAHDYRSSDLTAPASSLTRFSISHTNTTASHTLDGLLALLTGSPLLQELRLSHLIHARVSSEVDPSGRHSGIRLERLDIEPSTSSPRMRAQVMHEFCLTHVGRLCPPERPPAAEVIAGNRDMQHASHWHMLATVVRKSGPTPASAPSSRPLRRLRSIRVDMHI